MKRSTYIRLALLTLVAMGILAVPVGWGSHQGVETMFNAPLRWIPRTSPAREEFNRFLDQFENHEAVLISWPGCTVDDQRLEQVVEALMNIRDRRLAAGQPDLYNQVVTGYSLLRTLTGEPIVLSRSAALRRLRGSLVGPDQKTSCAVVVLTDRGALDRIEAMDLILDTVKQETGFGRDELHLAGPAVDGIAIDTESIRSIHRYAVPSALISLVLCCICLRSVWLTLPIVAVGALGQGLMLAAVYYIGASMNAILIVLPPLLFVLTVSAGVHLVNYFADERGPGRTEGATTRALRKGWGPCMLAAVTTAIGLASLTISEVQPVKQFGALAAPGVLVCVVLLFLLLPGAMELGLGWNARRNRVPAAPVSWSPGPSRPDQWQRAAAFVSRFAGWIAALAFLLIVICGVGLTWVRTSVNVVTLLTPQNRAVRDFHWFQQRVGPLIPVEVLIHFDDYCSLDRLQRMEVVYQAQRELSKIEVLSGAMSAASFFPNIPAPGGLRSTARRAVLRRQIERRQEELVTAQYLAVTDQAETWRISGRVLGRKDVDYGRFLDQLKERVSPVIAEYGNFGYAGISASYTGVTAVVYDVQRAMLADLFYSFLTALVLVTIVMVLALRSVPAGLLAMVPNVFPTLILFGAMGWLDRAVDIGMVMTGSVALGIAVDGTVHFLKWFRHEINLGKSRHEAVGYAYGHCGRALTQTTVICTFGLLVYGMSGFLPARHFAWVLMLLLMLALVGDLVVLPALLVGPLGRFFVIRRKPVERPSQHEAGATCLAH